MAEHAVDAAEGLEDAQLPAPAPPPTCCYAFITNCHLEGLGSDGLRPCYRCGQSGLHHHFCALHDLIRTKADEPAGPNTSLCAKCSGQEDLSDATHSIDCTAVRAEEGEHVNNLAAGDERVEETTGQSKHTSPPHMTMNERESWRRANEALDASAVL
eukprot:6206273-Pleurochrysis_carterae.AAC.1